MRNLVIMMALALTAGCGSVDDPPLGGPYGGTTGGTDPNSGQNPDQTGGGGGGGGGGSTDAGTSNTTKDSGSQTSTKDSGSQQTTQDSGSQQTQTAPTWTQIFNNYLAGSSGTIGKCRGCHSQGSSAANLYSWLHNKGYINGTSSALVDSNQSCLSWYGGNMPPSGPSSSAAVKDMNAWAAAGALNN